jgi:hypothetical protein
MLDSCVLPWGVQDGNLRHENRNLHPLTGRGSTALQVLHATPLINLYKKV